MPAEVDSPTIGRLLDEAARRLRDAGRPTPRLDAEVLLAAVLGVTRTTLYVWPERVVGPDAEGRWRHLLERRLQGEPVAYLTGHREFMSLDFEVSPVCLIPRAETELLVETTLELLLAPGRIADVGTGSGAIAVSLAQHRHEVWATDVNQPALQLAERNAARQGVADRVHLVHGSFLEGVPGGLDVVVSNPPYVAEPEFSQLGVGVRDYEPKSALVAGPTGLECYPALAQQAFERLQPGGWLLVEMAPWQRDDVLACLLSAGFQSGHSKNDLAGLPRVAAGQRGRSA